MGREICMGGDSGASWARRADFVFNDGREPPRMGGLGQTANAGAVTRQLTEITHTLFQPLGLTKWKIHPIMLP